MSLSTQEPLQERTFSTRAPAAVQALLDCLPKAAKRPEPLPLSFFEIGHGYRSGRSLGVSILGHALACLLLVIAGRHGLIQPRMIARAQLNPVASVTPLVLPTLGGGSQGAGEAGGGKGTPGEPSSGLRARSRRGFAYPGPQPLVSNPPQATLGIQTILQPSLENLPRLKRYVPLPNIVQPPVTVVEQSPREPAMVVKSGKLALSHRIEKPIAAPKITLPVAENSAIASLAESKPQLPQRAIPAPVDASKISGGRRAQKGLLVLNAVPPPPDVSGKLPMGEARAQFAVSPAEATIIAEPAAGTVTGGLPSMATGSGSRNDIASGDTVAEIAAGGNGTNHGPSGSGTGNGGHYGNAEGAGLNAESNAGGTTGRGTTTGSGAGTGTTASRGSGAGAGTAPGSGGFSGIAIAIQGGRYGNGNTGSMLAKAAPRHQSSYDMTIVSTSNSGGGLPDLGVFQDEKVYTVYLDMRANDEDTAPSWTLQYAVLQPAADDQGAATRVLGTPTAPFPVLKEFPELTPEMMRTVKHQLIVASAIMDVTGKLEKVSVKQTPESALIAPLVEALSQWMFEPAQIDGKPVALKILLGIRLAVH